MSNGAKTQAMYQAFNENRYDDVLPGASDSIELVLYPFGQTFHGHAGFLSFIQGFKTAVPDCAVEIVNQVESNGQVVNEIRVTGTHTGPLMTPAGEIPATGNPIEYRGCEVWSFQDGKAVRLHNYFDSATLMRQIGAA